MNCVYDQRKKIVFGSPEKSRTNLSHLNINSEKVNKMEFLNELWSFLRVRKKLWLAPIIMVMIVLGGLLILAQGSVVAPFIYTLF